MCLTHTDRRIVILRLPWNFYLSVGFWIYCNVPYCERSALRPRLRSAVGRHRLILGGAGGFVALVLSNVVVMM